VLTREPMSVVSTAVSRSSGEKETPSMGAVRHRSEASSNSWRIRSRSCSSLVSAYVPHTSADGGLHGAAERWSDAPERGGHARPATTCCARDAILSSCCCFGVEWGKAERGRVCSGCCVIRQVVPNPDGPPYVATVR
jgi:hypothetical protein